MLKVIFGGLLKLFLLTVVIVALEIALFQGSVIAAAIIWLAIGCGWLFLSPAGFLFRGRG